MEIIQTLFGSDIYYDNEVLHIGAENGELVNNTGYAKITAVGAVPSTTSKMGTYSADLTGAKYMTFDGTSALNFATSNFTIEGWINPSAAANATYGSAIIDARTAASSACIYLGRKPTGQLAVKSSGAWLGTGTTVLQTGTWYHVAYSRIAGTGYLFVDGILEASFSDATNYVASATSKIGYGLENAAQAGNIYLDDFRVTKNVGKYKTSFILPTTESSTQSFSVPEFDPHWSNVLVYHRFNQPYNNADELGRTFTNTGVTYDSSIKKFGTHSGYFDGGANLATTTDIAKFNVSVTDFTVEAWVYPTVINTRAQNTILETGSWQLYVSNTGYLSWYSHGVIGVSSSASGIKVPLNQWTHVAATRSGTAITLWVNGAQVAQNLTVNGSSYSIGRFQIGATATAGQHFSGYIDEARVTRGVNRYPTAFTPMQNMFPIGEKPMPASGDLFLNRVVVSAPFNNSLDPAFTSSGVSFDDSIVKFGTHSAKFNTTSSYVYVPLIQFGTGEFTVEGWAYATSISASRMLFSNANIWSNVGGNSWWVGSANTGDTTRLAFNRYGTTTYSASGVIPTGSWFHWAVTRTNGIVRVFVNGDSVIEVTDTNTFSPPSTATFAVIGNQVGTNAWAGNIDDVRITLGVSRYSGNRLTVPSAAFPLTQATPEYSTEYAADPFKASTIVAIDFDRVSAYNKAVTSAVINANVPSGVAGFIENGSGYFNGTTSSITLPANSVELLASNFTIEMWICPTGAHPSFGGIFGTSSAGNYQSIALVNEAGVLSIYSTTTSGQWNVFSGSTGIALTLNQWQHIAVVRNGATLTVFYNGKPTVLSTPTLTAGSSLYHSSTHTPSFGAYGTQRYIGMIDNARVTTAARYTDSFAPSARLSK